MTSRSSFDAELWSPISGFPNYRVSTNGCIMNVKNGRLLRTQANQQGYLQIRLTNYAGSKTFSIHRLVMASFRGPIPEGHVVKPIDGDKSNTRLANLETISGSESVRRAIESGLRPPPKSVRCIETGEVFASISDAARSIKAPRTTVSRSIKMNADARGFHFEFAGKAD